MQASALYQYQYCNRGDENQFKVQEYTLNVCNLCYYRVHAEVQMNKLRSFQGVLKDLTVAF